MDENVGVWYVEDTCSTFCFCLTVEGILFDSLTSERWRAAVS